MATPEACVTSKSGGVRSLSPPLRMSTKPLTLGAGRAKLFNVQVLASSIIGTFEDGVASCGGF